MAGTAHALHRHRDRARGVDLADKVDLADVDPELERSRRNQDLDFAVLQALLGIEAERARERAVVARDIFRSQALRKLDRNLLH